MSIFDQVNEGIKEAMKARDAVRLEALRGIKKSMLEAKTAISADHELTAEESIKIISKLAKQGNDSAAIYTQQGRANLAEAEKAQVAIFEAFLPAMLSDAELEAAINKTELKKHYKTNSNLIRMVMQITIETVLM